VRSPDGELSAAGDRREGGPARSRPRPQPRPAAEPWTPPAEPDADLDDTVAPGTVVPEKEPSKKDPDEPPTRSRSAARAGARKAEAAVRRRRQGRVTAAASALVVLIAVLLVPQVRTILRQSFTQMPQQSVAIYFTSNPKISGTLLDVPLTVQGVNSGTSTYAVKVWTENAAGKVDGTTTAKIATSHGVTASVVTLPIATDAAEVWVSLDGTTQVLHYQI
jgi:hypothetical protein